MGRGDERIAWIRDVLDDERLDALICVLPTNVLMLSGYWPVVGTSVGVAMRDGRVAVLAPQDEEELARAGWAHDVRTYNPWSLTGTDGPAVSMRDPLRSLLGSLGIGRGRVGYEDTCVYQGASYAAMFDVQPSVPGILQEVAPQADVVAGASAIARLRSSLTRDELECVRLACGIAGDAFNSVALQLRPGLREPEAAAALATPMVVNGSARPGVQRTHAFTWCMAGANSADAGSAYARMRNYAMQPGDLVLIHCNSYINGYWTDITRTYCLGEPSERQRAMYQAIFAARTSALEAIRPGARAADVDAAARQVLEARGFGEYFTHGVGHNVGFSVISPEFPPRLHPDSPDVLEVGMTFNIEPAIYIKGYGGIRHCDVVTVVEGGAEVLTPFQARLEDMIVPYR